jgi:hypothetical protein
MLKRAWSACAFAVLAFILNGTAYAQRASETPEPFSRALIGTWKSPPDEMPLSSAFDESVWGAHAKSVRTVDLQIDPTGHGTLSVTKKVVDARGRTIKASTSVEQAQLTVGHSRPAASTRVEHDVTVVSAVRTYPDDPTYKWDLAGLKVEIATFDGDANTIEVRFEPLEGTGAFWQTLHRAGRAPARSDTEQQSHSRVTPGPGTRSQRTPAAAPSK